MFQSNQTIRRYPPKYFHLFVTTGIRKKVITNQIKRAKFENYVEKNLEVGKVGLRDVKVRKNRMHY